METIIKTDQKTIAAELVEAISTLSIANVVDMLAENGEYNIQDENDEIIHANKTAFLNWLAGRMDEFLIVNEDRTQLTYIIDQCIHCRIGNPVIIFENGRFPVFTRDPWQREKCGLMLEFYDNLISGITFCFVFLKTDNLYLYEKRCKRLLT
jgi:hypothetical protein